MRSKTIATLATLGLCSAICGCSAQADPDYPGEPLATVHGNLRATADYPWPAQTNGMQVGVLWLVQTTDGGKHPWVGETAETSGEFPNSFKLQLFAPPPPEAQGYSKQPWPGAEPQLHESYLGVVAVFAPGTDLKHVQPENILGISKEHHVIYFARDARINDPADGLAYESRFYNVPPKQGYHLIVTQKDEELYKQMRRCDANGLCVEGKHALTAFAQELARLRFAECTTLNPEAKTCTTYYDTELTAEQRAENERCTSLIEAQPIEPSAECRDLELPWRHPANPQEFETPVAIELGTSLLDVFL